MDIVSSVYKFDRSRFSKVATIYYIRKFWIIYAFAMCLGLFFMLWQRNGFGFWVGTIMLAYPLTVPVRYSMVMSARAADMFVRELHYEFGATRLEVHNDLGGITSAQLASIREVAIIRDTLILLFGKVGFLVLPLEAVTEDQRQVLIRRCNARGAADTQEN